MRAAACTGILLAGALAGCGGAGEPPAQGPEAALRLAASPRLEERLAGVRRLLQADAAGISELKPLLLRETDKLSAEERAILEEVLSISRRRAFARQVSASPLEVHCAPWEPDPHYRGWILTKRRIARDEPLLLSVVLARRVDQAPGLWMHHYDAEWALDAGLSEDALARQRHRTEPIDCRVNTGSSAGEDVFSARILLPGLSSLFAQAPLHSPSIAPSLETRTVQTRIRFFICPTAEGAQAAYQAVPWIPVEVVNAPQAILLDDRERYPGLLAAHLAPDDPRALQRARMDAYVPGLCDPARLLDHLAATRDPGSASAILRSLEAHAPVDGLDAVRVARANEGDLAAIRSLARDVPLHPAGFVLEEVPLPAAWSRLSPRPLKRLLEEGSADDALAAARLLHRIHHRDREVSVSYVRRLAEARVEPAGRFDALLALADRLVRTADFGAIAPFLAETRLLSPADLHPPHPLWSVPAPAHDARACDAAAAAFLRIADLDAKGFWELPRERRLLAPAASRDACITRIKAWWVKNQKRFG